MSYGDTSIKIYYSILERFIFIVVELSFIVTSAANNNLGNCYDVGNTSSPQFQSFVLIMLYITLVQMMIERVG